MNKVDKPDQVGEDIGYTRWTRAFPKNTKEFQKICAEIYEEGKTAGFIGGREYQKRDQTNLHKIVNEDCVMALAQLSGANAKIAEVLGRTIDKYIK